MIAALVVPWASATSSLAAAGSVSIRDVAIERFMATETSCGWTPSCRSRSMRERSVSAPRTADSLAADSCSAWRRDSAASRRRRTASLWRSSAADSARWATVASTPTKMLSSTAVTPSRTSAHSGRFPAVAISRRTTESAGA